MIPSSHSLPRAGIDNLVHMVAAEVRHKEVEVAGHLGSQVVVGPEASSQDRVDLGMGRELHSQVDHRMVAVPWDKESHVGDFLGKGHQNPADSLRAEARFDNGHVRDPELSIRCGKLQAARWSFPAAEEHFDTRNWESEVVYLASLVVKKSLSRKLRGSRHYLPMLQDHGFEFHSRWSQKFYRARQVPHASGQHPFRQVSYGSFQLGQRQN